jgi:hypothetical protein
MPASRRAVTDPHNQATPRHDYLDEMMNACCKKAARHDRAEQSAVPEQAVTPAWAHREPVLQKYNMLASGRVASPLMRLE